MGFLQKILGSISGNVAEVDAGNQVRVIPYDATPTSLAPKNRAAVPEDVGGLLGSGKEYKLARTIRVYQFAAGFDFSAPLFLGLYL